MSALPFSRKVCFGDMALVNHKWETLNPLQGMPREGYVLYSVCERCGLRMRETMTEQRGRPGSFVRRKKKLMFPYPVTPEEVGDEFAWNPPPGFNNVIKKFEYPPDWKEEE